MTAPWLSLVGCLPGGRVAPTAPANVLDAEAVFGSARLLEDMGVAPARRHPWPRPFADGLAALLERRGRATTVLATGDPMHFGVGATLAARVPADEMAVYPAPSAFSLAAARLCWPLAQVRCVSLHAAPEGEIVRHAADGARLLVLTRDGEAPAKIAAHLVAAGFGESAMTVLEALGSPEAATHSAMAEALRGAFHPLNVVAVACRDAGPVRLDALEHDGCVTRDEVRAVTVAALAGGRHLWDIGAGSGSVALEWCRGGGSATLFERDGARAAAARRNVAARAAAAMVLDGPAEAALAEAPEPDRVFLGGGVGDEALFAAVWARMPEGAVLVSNAVTVEGEAATMRRFSAHGGSLTRIALSHSDAVGRLHAMRPAMPVLQWQVTR